MLTTSMEISTNESTLVNNNSVVKIDFKMSFKINQSIRKKELLLIDKETS